MKSLARWFTRAVATSALLAASGCVRWAHVAPADLQVHGKAGQVCSAAATPLVWAVNTALYPVSVASLGKKTPSHDNLGYPGLAIENVAYFTCATLGLPLHALGRGAERAYFRLASREALEDHLIARLPDLSREDYALLVKTSGRTCPPSYDDEGAQLAPPPREFGLWSTRQTPRYGSKPHLGNPLPAAEWRDWLAAGRPRDAAAETAFVMKRALSFADPASRFAATYGAAQAALFEREDGASRALAAAQQWGAQLDEAALGAALRDPEPLTRERAALALAVIGTRDAADVLLRSLGGVSHRMRYEILSVLAMSSQGRAALASTLADPDQHTRIAAAAAIGRSAVGPDDPLLLAALGSADPRVSAAAARARALRDAAGGAR